MSREQEILDEIAALHKELTQITRSKHANRPLPDFWRVGQHVKLLVDKEWFAAKGMVVKIVNVTEPNLPANRQQVLYTDYINADWSGTYFTTSDEIELYVD